MLCVQWLVLLALIDVCLTKSLPSENESNDGVGVRCMNKRATSASTAPRMSLSISWKHATLVRCSPYQNRSAVVDIFSAACLVAIYMGKQLLESSECSNVCPMRQSRKNSDHPVPSVLDGCGIYSRWKLSATREQLSLSGTVCVALTPFLPLLQNGIVRRLWCKEQS